MPLPHSLTTAPHGDLDLRLETGAWPEEICGEMLISAPAPRGDLPYALFTPGYMIRLSLRPGTHGAPPDRFAWRARRIDSPSSRLLERCPQAFQITSLGYASVFGMPNMANTAPLPWRDRLFATWDVGRPVELDPRELRFLGEVGSKASWGPSMPMPGLLPFLFSTAHPIIDPERDCLWSVKLAPVNYAPFELQPSVVRYDGDGPDVRVWPVQDARIGGSMHCLSQTREWLILVESGNFKSDPGEMAGGPRTVLADLDSPAFLIRKAELERTPPGAPVPARRFRIAPPTGHFYAVYDDRDGIRILFEHMDGIDLGFFLRADDRDAVGEPIHPSQVGLYNMSMCPSSLSEIEVDSETGHVREHAKFREEWTYNLQLSAMDWSPQGLAAPTAHHVVYQGYRPHNISQRALDAYRERIDPRHLPAGEGGAVLATFERNGLRLKSAYRYPNIDVLPTSPIFVPRGAGATDDRWKLAGRDPGGHDGFVVVPALSDAGLRVDVFDAADVGRGPLATLGSPHGEGAPLLLHAAWMPSTGPAPAHQRLRFAADYTTAELDALPPDLRAAVLDVAAEL